MVLDLVIAMRNPQVDKRKLIDHGTFRSVINYFEKGCDELDTPPEVTDNSYGRHILSFLRKKRPGSGACKSKLDEYEGVEVGSDHWTGETHAWFLLIVRKYLLHNFGKEISFFKHLPLEKVPSCLVVPADVKDSQEDIFAGVAKAKYKKKKLDLQQKGLTEEQISEELPFDNIADDPIYRLAECKMNPTSMWADSSEIEWVSGVTQYLAFIRRFGVKSLSGGTSTTNQQGGGRSQLGSYGLGYFPNDLCDRVARFGSGEQAVQHTTTPFMPGTPVPTAKATGMVAGCSSLLFSPPTETAEL